jgi:hypothetical protein
MGQSNIVKKYSRFLIVLALSVLIVLGWAPWMDSQTIHDKVFKLKADKDGTMGWIILQNGTKIYTQICDYNVMWFPFGRYVASCEGGYYVTFWGKIIP